MELLIRSQDKYTLLKYNNKITIIDGTGMKEALNKSLFSALADMEQMKSLKDGWLVNVDDLTLGTYATKERALEVLDDIQNFLLGAGTESQELKELNITFEAWCACNRIGNTMIYQMPEN